MVTASPLFTTPSHLFHRDISIHSPSVSVYKLLACQYRWTSETLLLKPVVETIVFFLQTFYDVAMFILDAHIAFCIHFILVN